jgi:hypothetical protein
VLGETLGPALGTDRWRSAPALGKHWAHTGRCTKHSGDHWVLLGDTVITGRCTQDTAGTGTGPSAQRYWTYWHTRLQKEMSSGRWDARTHWGCTWDENSGLHWDWHSGALTLGDELGSSLGNSRLHRWRQTQEAGKAGPWPAAVVDGTPLGEPLGVSWAPLGDWLGATGRSAGSCWAVLGPTLGAQATNWARTRQAWDQCWDRARRQAASTLGGC